MTRTWEVVDRLLDWADRETSAEPMRWPGRLLIAAGGVVGACFVVLLVVEAAAFMSIGGTP